MKILTAEKRVDGYHWEIQTNDTDPNSVIRRQWANIEPIKGETDIELSARTSEYIEMQKSELQNEIDALAVPAAAPIPLTVGGEVLGGKTMARLNVIR